MAYYSRPYPARNHRRRQIPPAMYPQPGMPMQSMPGMPTPAYVNQVPPVVPEVPRPTYIRQQVKQPTKRDFLDIAHRSMPIQAIKAIDDMPPTIRHVCPRISPRNNPIRVLPAKHLPVPEFSSVPYYYCETCQEFVYSWVS